jgi:hypothetical protein
MLTNSTVLAIAGMVLDVLGAVILARSFVMKRPREVFRELKSFGVFDFHITPGARDLLLSWLVQSIEARTGAGILALGFFLQGLAQLLPPVSISHAGWLLGAAVVIAVVAFFRLQEWFVRVAARQASAFYEELADEASSDDWRQAIPARKAEIEAIAKDPRQWLAPRSGHPKIDTTLTSNDDSK